MSALLHRAVRSASSKLSIFFLESLDILETFSYPESNFKRKAFGRLMSQPINYLSCQPRYRLVAVTRPNLFSQLCHRKLSRHQTSWTSCFTPV